MTRPGEPVPTSTPPPPLPMNGDVASPGVPGGPRGSKVGAKPQSRSRTREGSSGLTSTRSRSHEGNSAQLSEPASEVCKYEGTFEDKRTSTPSPVDHESASLTPVRNVASPAPLPSSAQKLRRLRDTTPSSTGVNMGADTAELPPQSHSTDLNASRDKSREGNKRRSTATNQDVSSPDGRSTVAPTVAVVEPEVDGVVSSWLSQLGLACYHGVFAAHHVTADLLLELDTEALDKIGVASWGHRCVLLRAVAARRKDLAGDGAYFPNDQDDGAAGLGLRYVRKRGGERDKSAGMTGMSATTGVANVAGPAGLGSVNSHGSLKDVYDQLENMKIHFESQLEQLNRDLQALKTSIPAPAPVVAGGPHRGGSAGGKGGKSAGSNEGRNGPIESNTKRSGDGGVHERSGGGNKNANKGGGRKESEGSGMADLSGPGGAGMGGIQGFGFVGHQGMGVGSGQKVNTGYMRSNASMGYANMANPMYNAYPGLNLAYYNSLAMMQSGMGGGAYDGFDANAQYYMQPAVQGVIVQDAYGSFGPEMMSSQGTGGMEVAPVTAPPPPTDTTDDNGQAQADAS